MIVPGDNNPISSPRRDRRDLPTAAGAGRSVSDGRPVGNVVPMQRPSEAQLLMALAEMHRQGSLNPKDLEKSEDGR